MNIMSVLKSKIGQVFTIVTFGDTELTGMLSCCERNGQDDIYQVTNGSTGDFFVFCPFEVTKFVDGIFYIH